MCSSLISTHPDLHLHSASAPTPACVPASRTRSDTRMTSGKLPALGAEGAAGYLIRGTEKTSEAVDRREIGVMSPLWGKERVLQVANKIGLWCAR